MTILEHSIMQLTGPQGTAEFNVDPKSEMLEIKMGKEHRWFKRVDLWALVFAISDPERQADMIPVKRSEVVTYKRIHNIKLKKGMPAGSIVKCHCEINVEQTIVEGLRGMIEQQKKSSIGALPIIGAKK